MTQRRSLILGAALLLLPLLAAAPAARADSMAAIAAAAFQVGDADGVYVIGTGGDTAREEASLACSYWVTGTTLPTNVDVIQLTITYDPGMLEYEDWSVDDFGRIADPYWEGDVTVDDGTAGIVRFYLDAFSVTAETTPTEFLWVKFSPQCQPEENPNTVAVATGEFDSFVMEGAQKYKTVPEACVDGTLTTADYDGYVSIQDTDPSDTDPETLVLQGVVGVPTEIEVPVYLNTTANVAAVQGRILFDETKLTMLDAVIETECNPWIWSGDTIPAPVDGTFTFTLMNYPNQTNAEVGLCRMMTLRFQVEGDWEGETTPIAFDAAYDNKVVVGQLIMPLCFALSDAYSFHDGAVEIENYSGELSATVDRMIDADALPVPGEVTLFPFWTTISATHNFIIGGGSDGTADGAPLRIDLTLPDGMTFDVLGSPPPENDFFWHFSHTGKGTNLELWSEPMTGYDNYRDITDVPTPLVEARLIRTIDGPPADFDGHTIPIAFAADNGDGRVARLRDAPTATISAVHADSTLTWSDTPPSLDFACGELSCDYGWSTKPASVVQTYYVRSSFELTDFTVTVNKSGAHHIVDFEAGEGVTVVDDGSDFVTFAADPSTWEPGVFETRRAIGTITYNCSYIPDEEIEEIVDKDIGPPIRWCWTTTYITFDRASTLTAAGGYNPIMYWIENNVASRWNCSVITDPLPQPKGEELPIAFDLRPNYPNPFNPQTTIAFDLPRDAFVQIDVLDVSGRIVRTLVAGTRTAGRHEVIWDGKDASGRQVASGIYFSLMRAGDFEKLGKMVLLK